MGSKLLFYLLTLIHQIHADLLICTSMQTLNSTTSAYFSSKLANIKGCLDHSECRVIPARRLYSHVMTAWTRNRSRLIRCPPVFGNSDADAYPQRKWSRAGYEGHASYLQTGSPLGCAWTIATSRARGSIC